MNICGFEIDDKDNSWVDKYTLANRDIVNNPQSSAGDIKKAITDIVYRLNYNLCFIEKQHLMVPQYNRLCYSLDYFDKPHISENLKEKLAFAITQWLCVANTKEEVIFDFDNVFFKDTDRPEFFMAALQICAKTEIYFKSENGKSFTDYEPVLKQWLDTVKSRMVGNIVHGGDMGLLKHLKEKLNWLRPITSNVHARNEETLALLNTVVTDLVPSMAVVLELHGYTKIQEVWKLFTQHQIQQRLQVNDINQEEMPTF